MTPESYSKFVKDVTTLVQANRPLWFRVSKTGVCTWRYLDQLAKGTYEAPTVQKLMAVRDAIKAEKAATRAAKKSA